MKNSLETKLGFFVAITVCAAVLIIETLGSADLFSRGKHVSALFDTVQDLKVGDRVKMAGVEIGRVEKIALADNKVSVTLKLKLDANVKTDSKAVIKFTGLMGQNFVNVSFGAPGSPTADEGAVLQTDEQPDLSAIMAKLDNAAAGIQNLTKSFTGDKIDNLLGPLTDFIKQNGAPITATIANVKNVTSQIAAGQGSVGKMIYNDTLYNSALSTVSNLQDTAILVQTEVKNITSGQGTIGKLLTDDTLYHSTTASMTNLESILIKVNSGQGSVGKLVNDQDFLKNAKLSLQKLDKAADSLEDTGPLSVIGIMAKQFGL
jgi:phospholipid/cholesterol/gamma-HCH transport system substrate-binding protein